jgi:hypothetical protein
MLTLFDGLCFVGFINPIGVVASSLETENTAVEIRCSDHATSLSPKVGTNFADKRRRSVGVVRSRAKATGFFLLVSLLMSGDRD